MSVLLLLNNYYYYGVQLKIILTMRNVNIIKINVTNCDNIVRFSIDFFCFYSEVLLNHLFLYINNVVQSTLI